MEVDMEIEEQEMMIQLAQGYEPGSSDWVDITHVNNPDSFYVRPTKYNQILMDLESKVPKKRPHRFYMHKCVVLQCCSPFTPIQYIRGQIVNIDDTQEDDIYFDIFAVDYGCILRSVPSGRIWKCRRSVLNYTPMAFQCRLANCSPMDGDEWSEESIRTMISYFSDERAKMTVLDKTSTKLIVEMRNTREDAITTLLSLTELSRPKPRAYVVYRAPTPPPPPPPQQQSNARQYRSG